MVAMKQVIQIWKIDLSSFFDIEQQENVAFIMGWLTQSDTDGPKFLEFDIEHEFSEQVFNAIREVV